MRASTAAALAIAAVGSAAAAVYLWNQSQGGGSSGVSACLVSPSQSCVTSLTLRPGNPVELAVTAANGKTPISVQATIDGTPASVHPWSVTETGYTYTINFGSASSTQVGSHSLYATVTFSDGSTSTTNTVSLTITSGTKCSGGEVACYSDGAISACCPSGDSCMNAAGNCAANEEADPSNPGCCMPSTSEARYPGGYIVNNPVYIAVQVCQPVCNDLVCEGCCGTPVVTGLSTSFEIEVLDENGAPLTGVVMLWQWNSNPLGLVFDAQSYVTDGNGKVYPTVSIPSNSVPTECNGGNYNIGSASVVFGMQGAPTGSAVAQLQVDVAGAWTANVGSFGSCGSC
jgi:hypothetical protein